MAKLEPAVVQKLSANFNFYRTKQEIGGYSVAVPKGTRIVLGTVGTVIKPTLPIKNSANQDAFSGFKEADLGKSITPATADPNQIEYLLSLLD